MESLVITWWLLLSHPELKAKLLQLPCLFGGLRNAGTINILRTQMKLVILIWTHWDQHRKMQLWGTARHMLHPEKQGAQRITSAWRVPLKEKKRKRTGSTCEAMVNDNEREEEEEGDTAPARYPKRARSWSQLWMDIFLVMLINNIHWYLVMKVNWPLFWWC